MYPIQNDYQKRMRANSEKVRNHIGSIPIEKTKFMISLVPEGKKLQGTARRISGNI